MRKVANRPTNVITFLRAWAALAADYGCGRLPPRLVLRLLLPLLALFFLATVGLSAAFFPPPFDFRKHVISLLACVRENPCGYQFFAVGTVTGAVMLLPLPGYLWRNLGGHGIWQGAGCFFLGAVN